MIKVMPTLFHKTINLFIVALLLVALLPAIPAKALTGGEFTPGNIIDDGTFFTTTDMDIQGFLNSKVPVCDTNGTQMHSSGQTRAAYSAGRGISTPFTCLKSYREDVTARSAETGLCNGISSGNKSSAQIIYEVGQSCGINPRVLIVLLQKEQSLITDDWPWPIQYRSATGYGCPDTAPCDAEYYGFFNQVYTAARQFKRYARDSSSFNYRAGRNNYIQYNPNASCGGSTVYIENQATAGLYNYTPYQPNPSALNNLYGSGDSCGAYGNRNFWRIYSDWFGLTYSGNIGPYAYRLYNPGRRDHNFTARENQRAGIKGLGFRDDGLAFKVGQTQEVGMVPIYRMYNSRLTDYWMIPDGMSRYWAIVHGGYRDEGVAFYAYPSNVGTQGSICSTGQAIFQMWHGGVGDHYYTTSEDARYWSLIYGGYVDDRSGNYNNPNQGSAAFCVPY